MSDAQWQRFLAAGEQVAAEPELFSGLVVFLEAIANGSDSRQVVLGYLDEWLRRTGVPAASVADWTPRQIADVLCLVEPRLAELERQLDTAIGLMSATTRMQVAEWSLSSHRGEDPTIPPSIAQLLALLHEPPEPAP